jgi:DNA-binding IclR family transcriptional regulator
MPVAGPRRTRTSTTPPLASVSNAARLLKEFRGGAPELGISELARRLGLGKSTVHRLASTLVGERLLEQNPDNGQYRLGLVLYDLGTAVPIHKQLHEAAMPVLESLRQKTRESVQIAVRDGREVVYVERLESLHALQIFRRVGHRNWVHCTSTGKVLLAELGDDAVDDLLGDWELPTRTQRTIRDHPALRREVARVRSQGYGVNLGESEDGVTSVAAAIRTSHGGALAAISLVGPTVRLGPTTVPALAAIVTEAASAVSRRLGYSRP